MEGLNGAGDGVGGGEHKALDGPEVGRRVSWVGVGRRRQGLGQCQQEVQGGACAGDLGGGEHDAQGGGEVA